MLRVIEEHLPPLVRSGSGMGRPAYENLPFFRAFLGMSFFRITTTGALRNRLQTDPNLRQICGFSDVPSLAIFSHRFAELAALPLATRVLKGKVRQYHERAESSGIFRAISRPFLRGKSLSTRSGMSRFQPGLSASGVVPEKGKFVHPNNPEGLSGNSG
jgi:hypothetical protein